MRVFISVDMEGIAGVATIDQIIRGGSGYSRAQELMTAEANAAVRGAYAGGADEVLVNDSHGTMDNLLPDRLDPRARIVFGAPRPSCMVQGITRQDAAAVFVGYHAGAGAHGVLSHTFSSNFTELRVGGQPMTEAEVNALYAWSLGVPVAAVTGDDQICAVAQKAFPGASAIEVKRAGGWASADSLPPAAACELVEHGVAEAVRRAPELSPQPVPDELPLEVDFTTPLGADFASTVPRTARLSARTLQYQAEDVGELLAAIMSWYYLGALAAQQTAAIVTRR